MTESGLNEVLVALARLEEQIKALREKQQQMDDDRQRARLEVDFKHEQLNHRLTEHRRGFDKVVLDISREISDIKAELSGGAATRRFIVAAAGVAAGVATAIGVVVSLITH